MLDHQALSPGFHDFIHPLSDVQGSLTLILYSEFDATSNLRQVLLEILFAAFGRHLEERLPVQVEHIEDFDYIPTLDN